MSLIGNATDGWACQDLGYKAWSFDPYHINDTFVTVTGKAYWSQVKVGSLPISSVSTQLDVLLATGKYGENRVGVYDAGSKALLGQTVDQTVAWSLAGNKEKVVTANLAKTEAKTVALTGKTEVGTTIILSTTTAALEPGMKIKAVAGVIAASTYVVSVTNGTEIVISVAAEKAEAAQALEFEGLIATDRKS